MNTRQQIMETALKALFATAALLSLIVLPQLVFAQ